MSMPEPFKIAVPLLKRIEEGGFEAYFVGGCVRDYLLDRAINDVDIATSAFPQEVKHLFKRTVDVGIEHGTVMVIEDEVGFEITTFRTESTYSDFRRPDEVKFVRTLKDDLKRRDYTINAMAMSSDFKLIDLFNGQKDLTNRKIRTVGKAEERFQEDALRMLRGARFASQLDFEIEHDIYTAMKKCANLMQHIAIERKRMEMDKLLLGRSMQNGLYLLLRTGLDKQLPSLNLTNDVIMKLKKMDSTELTINQKWALMILIGNEKDTNTFLKNWRHSNKRTVAIKKLVQIYTKRAKENWNKELLYRSGIELAIEVEQIHSVMNHIPLDKTNLNKLWASLQIKNRDELKVNGKDLISWVHRDHGPWIGICLNEIETLIILNRLPNNANDIKKWVEQWQQK